MSIQLLYLEKDIEDLLADDCEHYLGIKFLARQFRTPVGIIDVIAKSCDNPYVYFSIELKKDKIDSTAYCQSLRYSNWLNSELSKGGKRLFIPIVIGSSLAEDLHFLCEYFDADDFNHFNLAVYKDVFYRLFDFCPKTGVSFNFHNSAQEKQKNLLRKYHNHIDAICGRADYFEYALHEERTSKLNPAVHLNLVKNESEAS